MMKRPPLTLSLRATQSFKFKRLAEIFQADSQEALWPAALQPRVPPGHCWVPECVSSMAENLVVVVVVGPALALM